MPTFSNCRVAEWELERMFSRAKAYFDRNPDALVYEEDRNSVRVATYPLVDIEPDAAV
jgi:hypothetical protein